MDTSSQTNVLEKPKTKTRHYPHWQVIGLNDDVTPMDYVVFLIMDIFHKSEESAFKLMIEVHENECASFYVGTREACELKLEQTKDMNEKHDQKLQVRMEPMEN